MNHTPTTHKFVVVINKKVPVGNAMNAIGHMAAGLAALVSQQDAAADMRFDTYIDKDGGRHESISDNPFIVLRADNSNKLRNFRNELIAAGLPVTDFTDTMVEGTYAEQHERTSQTPEAELEYWGVCTFGEVDEINTLTKKFSLWR